MTPDQAVHLLDPRHTFCFLPHVILLDGEQAPKRLTECNCFAKCVCACLGVYLPPLQANQQRDYLADPANGWRLVDAGDAALHAARHDLVLAVWKNPTGGAGHIGVLSSPSTRGALYVSAAGAANVECVPLANSFGLAIHPEFFLKELSHG